MPSAVRVEKELSWKGIPRPLTLFTFLNAANRSTASAAALGLQDE